MIQIETVHLLDDAILDVDVLLKDAVIVHHSAALDEQSLLRALFVEREVERTQLAV